MLDGLVSIPFVAPGAIALYAGPSEIDTCTIGGEFGLCEVPTNGTFALAILLYLIGGIGYVVFYCRRVGKTGQSIGMKATGYQIVDSRTGEFIGTGRAVGRYFARILSYLPCYLGLLWPLWDSENRTFHDMIVNTRAIKTN